MSSVSVVIPTFNRADFLLRALESVLAQTFQDMEIIIVDDGSRDHTKKSVLGVIEEKRGVYIHYVWMENGGVAAARNRGVQEASGRWIAFLDSDDVWMPEKLSRQVEFLGDHPEIRIVYTQERWIRNGRRVNAPKSYARYGGDVFLRCLPVCMIGASSVLLEKDLFEKMGGFNPIFPLCEDYDLWLRMSNRYEVGFIDEELIWKYGGHSDQLSRSIGMDYWRIRSLCAVLDTEPLSPSKVKAVLAELERRAGIYLAGCRKHGNWERYEEVVGLIKGVHPFFDPEINFPQ